MSSLKKLIHEVHRRSLWQVLGVYLFASWGALQVVEVVTESVGLPDWAPGLAFVLLIIGLPMCLATAIVQEGLPGGQDQGQAPSPDMASGTSERVGAGDPAPPAPGLRAHHRLFTWRNAMMGGVGAFALLGVAVTAYFVMWSTGVGPVGSLVAQGVFDERERVVLANFDNASQDAGLGSVVTEALRIDLLASPALRVVEGTEVAEVLARMARDPDQPFTAEVAREVAVREGIKAIIEGEVGSAGSGFVLTASIREAESGRTLAAFRETAGGGDEVIDAIDKLSQRIRERAGESLRSIRAGGPLGEVTTPSLEALRRYTQATDAIEAGDDREGIAFLEQALARDSTFAMAWRKLAVVLSNNGIEPLRIREAATRAYELRDRLTERERYLTEAYYHSTVTGNRDRVIEAYRHVLRLDPDDGTALNNLALQYQQIEDFEAAEELLRRAVGGEARSINASLNLVVNQLQRGRVEAARDAVADFEALYGDVPMTALARLWVHVAAGEDEEGREVAEALLSSEDVFPMVRLAAYSSLFDLAVRRGRVSEALARWDEAAAMAMAADPTVVLEGLAGNVLDRALLGVRPEEALARLDDALERGLLEEADPASTPYPILASAYAWSGRAGRAEEILGRWERDLSVELRGPEYREQRELVRGVIRAAEGDAAAGIRGIRALQEARRCTRCFRAALAELYARSGDTRQAIAEYEALLTDFEMMRSGFNTAVALQRLGPLHEEVGDSAKAADAYARFAELWADADSDLQPRVRHARERAEALGSGSSGS